MKRRWKSDSNMNHEFLSKALTTNLKGIAILLIVVSHIGDGGFHHRVFVPLGGIGVAIFLILSGYGLMESYKLKGLDNYFNNRVMRLFIPYIIWISAYVLIMSCIGQSVGLSEIRYWFVEYISLWYVAFFFTFKYFNRYRWTIFGLIALLSFWILPCLQAQQSLSFITGIAISEYKGKIVYISKSSLFRYAILFLAIGALAFVAKQLIAMNISTSASVDVMIESNVGDDDILRKLVQIFTKLPTSLAVIMLFLIWDRVPHFTFLGNNAYELYLVHMPFYGMINSNYYNLMLFLLLITFATIVLGWSNRKVTKVISKMMGTN